ncbi:hypothetical protein GQ600_15783 [Phytophthora cactorum]|nr:hypothetical protein GQ600_15783 [Phytophthora cactorum]
MMVSLYCAESRRIINPDVLLSLPQDEEAGSSCTARKLSVAKNTNKADRVTILQGYDESRTAMELLLESQRLGKRTRDAVRTIRATFAGLFVPVTQCPLLRRLF